MVKILFLRSLMSFRLQKADIIMGLLLRHATNCQYKMNMIGHNHIIP